MLTNIVLVSCASKPRINYPLLPAPTTKDKALDCAARAGASDLNLLASLQALDQNYQDGKIKQKELLATRTELLDALPDPASLQPPAPLNSVSPPH